MRKIITTLTKDISFALSQLRTILGEPEEEDERKAIETCEQSDNDT